MKPYAHYRPLHSLNANKIPSHWGSSKLRYLAKIQTGTTPASTKEDAFQEGSGLPWFTPDDLDETGVPSQAGKFLTIQGEEEVKPVAAGSTLICCIGSIGKAGIIDVEASSNQQINAVTFRESSRFGFYSILGSKEAMECLATGNVLRILNSTRLGSIEIPLPPRSERELISQYLDRETAKIDALIAEQQRLIELLQEKRQAVISHAVTKGLNPDAPMKDSGVEWLGEVPEHWEVKRLKDISSIIDCRNKTPDYVENGEYLVVRTTNIKERSLVLEDAKYTDELNFKIWTQRGVPRAGSIFFTREAPAGETALVPEGVPLCMGQRMMNIDAPSENLTGYILCFLQSSCLKRYIEACSMGSIVGHLRVPQVENLPLPVPPTAEQELIARRTAELDDTFDEVTSNLTTSINLLKERRSALISAAVTGQIDVRGLVEAEGSEK